jgi:hypothetical protein
MTDGGRWGERVHHDQNAPRRTEVGSRPVNAEDITTLQ